MEFWQKKLKRNKEDILQTTRDVYNLPVEFETNEVQDFLIGCYYNHIREAGELENFHLVGWKDFTKHNKRVFTKVHLHFDRDSRRYWRLASVWYKDSKMVEHPFMVIQNGGREGDDSFSRIISDPFYFLQACEYLEKLDLYALDYERMKDIYAYSFEEDFDTSLSHLKEDTYFVREDEVFEIRLPQSHWL